MEDQIGIFDSFDCDLQQGKASAEIEVFPHYSTVRDVMQNQLDLIFHMKLFIGDR